MQFAYYDSPFGTIRIGWENDAVASISCVSRTEAANESSDLTDRAMGQLLEYFAGTRSRFTFPIRPKGTPFQLAVWNALLEIPYGETRTYGQIAAMIGKPKAARAVGMGCNRNPLWIVVPCHRVVGSDRSLIGYAGGLDMKQRLLTLESVNRNRFDP